MNTKYSYLSTQTPGLSARSTTPKLEDIPGKKKKKPAVETGPPLNFFFKTARIFPDRIRAMNIRNILRNPPPFKLNLGSDSDLKIPKTFPDDVPYIFRVPEKIRVRIFKYIPTAERTCSLQLVCRQFRNEIRLRVGVQSMLHEKSRTGLTFYRDIIVESLTVGKYSNPYMSPKYLLIKPKNVKDLTFLEPISIQLFDAFLTRCDRIQRLCVRNHIHNALAPPSQTRPTKDFEWRGVDTILKYPTPLKNLKELIIDLSGGSRSVENFPTILQAINAKYLKRLAVKIDGGLVLGQTTSVHFAILPFIEPLNSLSHILVSTDQCDAYKWKGHDHLGFPRETLLSMSKGLKLREIILTESAVGFNTWSVFLQKQRRLEILQVLHLTVWSICRDIILKNCKTLRKVAIHVLLWEKPRDHVSLDLAVFQGCLGLAEIYIAVAAPVNPGYSDLINFQKLPKSVEALLLKNCTFQTKDILNIVDVMKNLRVLGVMSRCSWGDFGIKSGTVRKFLRMRLLDELFIFNYEIRDAKNMWTLKKKVVTALKSIGADAFGKQGILHFHGDDNIRWSREPDDDFTCSLITKWGN